MLESESSIEEADAPGCKDSLNDRSSHVNVNNLGCRWTDNIYESVNTARKSMGEDRNTRLHPSHSLAGYEVLPQHCLQVEAIGALALSSSGPRVTPSDRSESTPISSIVGNGHRTTRRYLYPSYLAVWLDRRENRNHRIDRGVQDPPGKFHIPSRPLKNQIHMPPGCVAHGRWCCYQCGYLLSWTVRKRDGGQCWIFPRTSTRSAQIHAHAKDLTRFSVCIEVPTIVVASLSVRMMYCFDQQAHHSRSHLANPTATMVPLCEPFASIIGQIIGTPEVALVTAVILYCAAVGLHYYHHMESKNHDAVLVCGATLGVMMGWVAGLSVEGIIFRILPGVILVVLLVNSCYFRLRQVHTTDL